MRRGFIFFFIAVLLLSAGCSEEELFYLLEQAPGQISLLLNRVPIERMLKKDKGLDPEVRRKLELVLDVKRYAEDEIGLVRNSSYTIYTEIDRDAVVYNLTACPRLSLKPLTWRFPVVGEVPYLGFFKKDNGLRKKAELEDAGCDVYLRRAGAYSMLGIVADPIYSPLLRWRDADLANLIIHELTHATVWVKGNVEFNENIALFIGNQGALEYCRDRLGKDSEVRYILASNEDDRIFSVYLNDLYGELNALYDRDDLSDQEKLKAKTEVFARSKKKFKKEVLPEMSSGRYRGFLELEMNNAVVTSRKVYYKDLSMYQEIFENLGSDLARMVEFLKDVELRGGDPEAYCREWLQANPRDLDD